MEGSGSCSRKRLSVSRTSRFEGKLCSDVPMQEILYDYLLSDELHGPPSIRLSQLGELRDRQLFHDALADNIEVVFRKELHDWGYQRTDDRD